MEAGELSRVEESLRGLCQRQELFWLLEQVDAAIRQGSARSVNPGSSAYRDRGIPQWSYFGVVHEGDRRRRPQTRVEEGQYTNEERVILLLDAMLAIYHDLPYLQDTAIQTLNAGWEGRVPLPESIVFVDDESTGGSTVYPVEQESEEYRVHRQEVVDTLTTLRRMVLA